MEKLKEKIARIENDAIRYIFFATQKNSTIRTILIDSAIETIVDHILKLQIEIKELKNEMQN